MAIVLPNFKKNQKEDGLAVSIGIDQEGRKEVSRHLSEFLVSTYALYFKTLYYHWNVTGSRFVELHKLFEKQYEDLSRAGDAIAERIRALGHFTPGTRQDFLQSTSIKDDPELPLTSEEMVCNLLDGHSECSRQARSAESAAKHAHDEVSSHMMIERMMVHDKAAWMLRAILE